jgi:hypothetical protein
VADLLLHGRPVATVFDLLGDKENDITYSLGWALANSDRLALDLLDDVLGSQGDTESPAISLQDFVSGGGYTDVEIKTPHRHLIVEAKRGWSLPSLAQLEKYAPQIERSQGVLLVIAEGSSEFADSAGCPRQAAGVAVHYRSWQQVTALVAVVASSARGAERRLLEELVRYLRGLMSARDPRDNMAYVVSIGQDPLSWSDLTFREIVERGHYFHPVGGGRGRWPKEPPNYLGFRWNGCLQSIHHVDAYEVMTEPHRHIPEIHAQTWEPHFLYHLGPAIRPSHTVKTGNLYATLRVWAAIDLLLTADTIKQARDLTNNRLDAAGG